MSNIICLSFNLTNSLPGMALKCLVSLSAPGGRFSLSILISGGERLKVATIEEEELESTARRRGT